MTAINRRGVDNCTVCGKPVLRLEGEYRNIDTYNMSERLVEAGAFGDIHVACLPQSVFDPDYHELTLHRLMVIFEMDGQALDNGGMLFAKKTTFFYYSPFHSLVKFTANDLKNLEKKGENYFLERNSQLWLTFGDEQFKTIVLNGLQANGEYPVWPLAEHLAITDKFCEPGLMREAQLLYDRSAARYWFDNVYWCGVRHRIKIAGEAIDMIGRLK